MTSVVTALLLLSGTFFVFVAAFGVVRMPDLMLRMHAATKAGVMGTGLLALALMVHFPDTGIWVRAVALIFFAILTSPVAAHMIGRAAHVSGIELWKGTVVDEAIGHEEDVRVRLRKRIARDVERERHSEQSQ